MVQIIDVTATVVALYPKPVAKLNPTTGLLDTHTLEFTLSPSMKKAVLACSKIEREDGTNPYFMQVKEGTNLCVISLNAGSLGALGKQGVPVALFPILAPNATFTAKVEIHEAGDTYFAREDGERVEKEYTKTGAKLIDMSITLAPAIQERLVDGMIRASVSAPVAPVATAKPAVEIEVKEEEPPVPPPTKVKAKALAGVKVK